MNDDIICYKCNYAMVYDMENTFYLKCPCCDEVLVDARAEDVWNEPLSIIDCGKSGDDFGSRLAIPRVLFIHVGDTDCLMLA